ncbi:IS30 family transposase, partial [Mycoplasmopsis primatum]|uniref:IS30 family transposase n=1 Tax=Mycoplasmopsis primatum TaxID=55604 RepID=UPI00068E8625
NRSVKTALKRAQINSTYLGKHCQQKCKTCGQKLKNEHVILISVYQFIHALATRHDSKKTSNNRKILSKWDPFLEFFIKKFKYFMKYKNSKDLNEKAVEESVQNIIFQFKQEMKKENKLDTVYIPSVSAFYRFLKKHKEISNKLDIFPYLSRGKGQKKQNVIKRDVKKKSIGELITERPESVNQRLNDNDYELDTVIGTTSDKYCILTLINRKTRMFYFTIVRRSALAVKQALISMIDKYHLTINTLTIDNGSENYRLSEIDCIKAIYHCHPYSSSEKGSIENCHRLLRRYFPKGKSLDKYVGQDTSKVMEYINSYARKIYSKNCVSNALSM